jgi:hypothetical protein
VPEEDNEEERREELKRCLVDTVYGSDLGFRASSEVRGEVLELVTQLEATNPTPEPVQATHLLAGNWILMSVLTILLSTHALLYFLSSFFYYYIVFIGLQYHSTTTSCYW